MNFKVHHICNQLVEVSVDSIETGTLNGKEASKLAREFLRVADELLSLKFEIQTARTEQNEIK